MAGKPARPSGQAVDAKQREEQLRRVTGQAAAKPRVAPPASPSLQVPLPARSVPGIQGTPPIPVGSVRVGAASSMTDAERQAMESVGWREGQPIPPDMARFFTEAQQRQLAKEAAALAETAGEYVAPVPEDTPPVSVNTVDIDQLPESSREEIRRAMEAANRQMKAWQEEQAQAARTAHLPPDVQQAIIQANAATTAATPTRQVPAIAPAPPAPPAATANVPTTRRDEPSPSKQAELPPLPAETQPAAASAKAAETALPETAPGATVAGHTLGECPHCGFDLSQPDIPEPDTVDRLNFLQSVLGERSFTKTYDLFGGGVRLTLRNLTGQELDAIYRQVQYEIRTGVITEASAVSERIQRYRLYLQLVSLRSSSFQHVMPEGFTVETNPHAHSHWQLPDDLPEGCPGLDRVETYIVAHVIKTESLHRTVRLSCNQFNRLVARMEALADNSDFWSAIDAQF